MDGKYDRMVELTGIQKIELQKFASTSRKVKPENRNMKLTYTHHVAVASLDEAGQKEILKSVEVDHLSVEDTRTEAKAYRIRNESKEEKQERMDSEANMKILQKEKEMEILLVGVSALKKEENKMKVINALFGKRVMTRTKFPKEWDAKKIQAYKDTKTHMIALQDALKSFSAIK